MLCPCMTSGNGPLQGSKGKRLTYAQINRNNGEEWAKTSAESPNSIFVIQSKKRAGVTAYSSTRRQGYQIQIKREAEHLWLGQGDTLVDQTLAYPRRSSLQRNSMKSVDMNEGSYGGHFLHSPSTFPHRREEKACPFPPEPHSQGGGFAVPPWV